MKIRIACSFFIVTCFSLMLMSDASSKKILEAQKNLSSDSKRKVRITSLPIKKKNWRSKTQSKKIKNSKITKGFSENNPSPKIQTEVEQPLLEKKEEKTQKADNDLDIWTLDTVEEQKKSFKKRMLVAGFLGIIGGGFIFYFSKKVPVFLDYSAEKFKIFKNFAAQVWHSIKKFGEAPPSSISVEEEKRIMQKLETDKAVLTLSKVAHSLYWIPSIFEAFGKVKNSFSERENF